MRVSQIERIGKSVSQRGKERDWEFIPSYYNEGKGVYGRLILTTAETDWKICFYRREERMKCPGNNVVNFLWLLYH